jgi:thymidylate synthase
MEGGESVVYMEAEQPLTGSESMLFEPLYKQNQLILGDPRSSVGIVTLWTRRSVVASRINSKRFAAIGQLYSGTRGINLLVRNLRYNPQIRTLFAMCKDDLSQSGIALRDFFLSGVKKAKNRAGLDKWKVNSPVDAFIDLEVPKQELDLIRRSIKLVNVNYIDELVEAVNSEPFGPSSPYADRARFDMREADLDAQPAEETGFLVRAPTIAQAWVQILYLIVTLGSQGDTHFAEGQRELLNLQTIITAEDPRHFDIPAFLPCTVETIGNYLPQVLTGQTKYDIGYTYGQRLQEHFGIKQIDAIIQKLVAEPISRSAVASLWDPKWDNQHGGSPCLNHIWVRLRGSKVFLTAIIRSNDMYNAWPQNAFSLRVLQDYVRQEVSSGLHTALCLGDLTILSESAHIYMGDLEAAKAISARYHNTAHGNLRFNTDPRGSFVIEVDQSSHMIRVEHLDGQEHIRSYQGRDAVTLLARLIGSEYVSLRAHAGYLGRELQKAELALQYPELFDYVQDRPLSRRVTEG